MEMKSKVVIVPCENYDRERVYEAMRCGLAAMGGLEHYVNKDEKILVKPNFLTTAAEDKAVTTHPAVIEAMLRILCEQGYAKVQYGDSPGHGSCQSAAEKLQLPQRLAAFGVHRADMETEVLVPFPEGAVCRNFHFAKGITEADAIINLCKMKTHALERITGAVKNVYGFICGARKAAGHVMFPNASTFARALTDIHRCTPIRLHIMDGVVAMEGNGPSSGDPVEMKVLLFANDPVALDAVFCHMIDLPCTQVPTCVQGRLSGIGTYDLDQVELSVAIPGGGVESITPRDIRERFGKPGFRVDRRGNSKTLLSFFSRVMVKMGKRPYIKKNLCVRCGICVAHCPVPGKAVDFRRGSSEPPVYDYSKCIRCYCCQEMCPQHAIAVKGKD